MLLTARQSDAMRDAMRDAMPGREPDQVGMTHAGVQFLQDFYGPSTEGPIFVCSLPNKRGDVPGEQRLTSRDGNKIARHAGKWDRPGRAFYFAVNPLRDGETTRSKDNVGELAALWSDTDFKDLASGTTVNEVLSAYRNLRLAPSAIVASGRGLHCYWFFKEAEEPTGETVTRVELTLRQLSDIVAGDPSVCEVARLMRLPGTHNTKDGAWIEARIVEAFPERRYELHELEEWLYDQSSVLQRRVNPDAAVPDKEMNPFLAAALRLGFKPTIDVEARLRDMRFEGTDKSAIHNTQRSVTASLLTRGHPLEDVVSIVLDATKTAQGVDSDRWNWRREERGIRDMCASWIKKNPVSTSVSKPAETIRIVEAPVDLGAARAAVSARKAPVGKPEKIKEHVILASIIVAAMAERGTPLLLEVEHDDSRQLWRCVDGLWRRCVSLDFEIEEAARVKNIQTTNRLRAEVLGAIRANPDLGILKGRWDQHGMVPAANGLVDWKSGTIRPYRPEDRATWRLTVPYDVTATCPMWSTAIRDFFRDKNDPAKFVGLLQDFMGTMLLHDRPRSISRALVLYGSSNAGKSEILRVLSGLHGSIIAQPLEQLDAPHGTVPFTRHAPWVLHEAFTQGKWVFSDIIKQLITQDPIQINIKYGSQFEHAFCGPVLWATNFPPSVKDGSKAVVNRMLIVPCGAGFDDEKTEGVLVNAHQAGYETISRFILETEGAGLLSWAIAGLRAITLRGRFDLPPEVSIEAQEMFDKSNIVAEFLRDCCAFDKERMIRISDFNAAFSIWWQEQHGDEKPRSPMAINIALKAHGADGRVAISRDELRTNDGRYFGGLVLNDEGMKYWHAVSLAVAAGGSMSGKHIHISKGATDVHAAVPADWLAKPSIIKMRLAFDRVEARAKLTEPPEKTVINQSDHLGDHLENKVVTPLVESGHPSGHLGPSSGHPSPRLAGKAKF